MWSVSFRWHLLQFAPNFRANFAESGKTLRRVYMKVRFKVSSLKFVRFFVDSKECLYGGKSGVSQMYILIISDGEKILSDVNVVVWRRVRRKNNSLRVAICVSKIRLLTLSTYILARVTSIGLCWCTNVFFFFAVFFILGANVECASQCPQFTTAFIVEKSGKFGKRR